MTYDPSFHAPTKPTPQSPAQQHASKPKTINSQSQLLALIRQSFDIFNTYGKDAAALENISLGFAETLKGVNPSAVDYAFKDWMKFKSTMPTPADIYEIAKAWKPPSQRYERQDQIQSSNIARPRIETPACAWYNLRWPEIISQGLEKTVLLHIRELGPQKGPEYCKFLRNHYGAPDGLYAASL